MVSAEINGVSQREANEMSLVNLFGPRFTRMFRDAINAVGNHGEVYERTLQQYIPRADGNLLNTIANPGPHTYVLPGFDLLTETMT